MKRMRKLSADDRNILAKVFKECGADWTYNALALWYGLEVTTEDLAKIKRWTSKRLAAFRFLNEITDDYTFNAIYSAAEEIVKDSRSSKRRKAG